MPLKLSAILARVFGDRNVAGIVWVTNGTGTLLGISSASGGGERRLRVSSSGGFDPSRVYEARVVGSSPMRSKASRSHLSSGG